MLSSGGWDWLPGIQRRVYTRVGKRPPLVPRLWILGLQPRRLIMQSSSPCCRSRCAVEVVMAWALLWGQLMKRWCSELNGLQNRSSKMLEDTAA